MPKVCLINAVTLKVCCVHFMEGEMSKFILRACGVLMVLTIFSVTAGCGGGGGGGSSASASGVATPGSVSVVTAN
jgi:hypothetical protein